jgi:hypothetical protein
MAAVANKAPRPRLFAKVGCGDSPLPSWPTAALDLRDPDRLCPRLSKESLGFVSLAEEVERGSVILEEVVAAGVTVSLADKRSSKQVIWK